jgi:DNA-directed RNA polymerase subunit RPC12/RpoP
MAGAFSGSVGVQCLECGTKIIVLPAALYEAIGNAFSGGIDTELQFLEQIKGDKAKTGDRLAIADVDGRYSCPECGHQEQLPPEDELRRLAEEQRRPNEGDELDSNG